MIQKLTLSSGNHNIIVKCGFSWFAFFFGFWPFLFRKMWKVGFFWLFFCIFWTVLSIWAHSDGSQFLILVLWLVRLGYSIIQGFSINGLYVDKLTSIGYVITKKT
ncbi:DUF2628 domain-containing protein [Proteus vulgaris]|uniref:DUF2628 domain-containing protein n=1 Tax=Proteus vulgaris TaxID=585 RepID=UPI0039A61510